MCVFQKITKITKKNKNDNICLLFETNRNAFHITCGRLNKEIIEVMLKGAALRDVPQPAEGLHNHHCARNYKSN